MLESLHLKNVGPAPEMKMDLAPRLNLITGDNGLGKSFLLDVAWWALTRTWAREMVLPRARARAEISYTFTAKSGRPYSHASSYQAARGRWSSKKVRHQYSNKPIAGLILYAQVDGAFSVWDPARNYGLGQRGAPPDGVSAFHFEPKEVWRGNRNCKGLIDDWALWQAGNSETFRILRKVLRLLSPSPTEPLTPGDLRKLTVADPQRYPTLCMPYGEQVPVTHASAGMRRILALAYLLTWAWQEHVDSSSLRGQRPTREVVFLVDEIEGHLHPQWQRRIVSALLTVVDALAGSSGAKVQLVATTHSPLVLASVEALFDPERDAWFDLDLENAAVVLRKRPFARLGEVGNWLTSDAFDLESPRSREAEEVLERAASLLSADTVEPRAAARMEGELHSVLGPEDPFWLRWRFVGERKGWLKARRQARDRGVL